MTSVDLGVPLEFSEIEWVNIAPIIISSVSKMVDRINSFQSAIETTQSSMKAIENRVNEKLTLLETMLEESRVQLQTSQQTMFEALQSEIRASKSTLSDDILVTKQQLEADLSRARQEITSGYESAVNSSRRTMEMKLNASVTEIDKQIQLLKDKDELLLQQASVLESKIRDMSETALKTKFELDIEDQRLLRKIENVISVLTGDVEARERSLREELARVDRMRTELQSQLKGVESKVSKDLKQLEAGIDEMFDKERQRELQDLRDMRELFSVNLNKLSEVQKEDLVNLRKDLREADITIHEGVTKATDKKLADLRESLQSLLDAGKKQTEENLAELEAHFEKSQTAHEGAVNMRFGALRQDVISESRAREESIMSLEERLQRSFEAQLKTRREIETMVSKIEEEMQHNKEDLESMMMEKSQQLTQDMQYMQRHLSRMLNENSSSSFARISEARFFALEARLKEEENVRINETVRLDQEVSKIEESIVPPAAVASPATQPGNLTRSATSRTALISSASTATPRPPAADPTSSAARNKQRGPPSSLPLSQITSPRSMGASSALPPVTGAEDTNSSMTVTPFVSTPRAFSLNSPRPVSGDLRR